MKKVILSVAALFAFGFSNAQDVNYGVKAGLNLSTLTGDVEDVKSLAGFHAGGFVEIKLTDKFAIQPELMYSTQGAKSEYSFSESGISVDAEEKINLGYLNLPVMAKYFVAPGFSIEAGPQVGFLLSAKNEYSYSASGFGITESSSEEIDIKDDTESMDFSFNVGAGYEFTENIFVQARYNFGLTNIAKDTEGDIKNGVIQVSVGYKF